MPRISWAKKNQLIWEIQQQYRTLITIILQAESASRVWICHTCIFKNEQNHFFMRLPQRNSPWPWVFFFLMYSLLCDLPNRLSWIKPFLYHQRYTVNSPTYLSFFFFLLLLLLLLLLLSNFFIFFRYSVSHHESVLTNLRWALSLAVLTDKLAAGPNFGRNADWLFSSLDKHRSAERKAAGSHPGRTNTQWAGSLNK